MECELYYRHAEVRAKYCRNKEKWNKTGTRFSKFKKKYGYFKYLIYTIIKDNKDGNKPRLK
jgi:hypothetical protein